MRDEGRVKETTGIWRGLRESRGMEWRLWGKEEEIGCECVMEEIEKREGTRERGRTAKRDGGRWMREREQSGR